MKLTWTVKFLTDLVKPFASVTVSGDATPDDAPENLPDSWLAIHDGLAQLLLQAIETLPKQILVASNLGDSEISNLALDGEWIVAQVNSWITVS